MKDEIKETLEDVKRHLDYVEATKQCSIRDNEMKAMYDYITNLQKKYEEADYDRHKLFEAKEKLQNDYQEAVDKITNLQEENEYSDYCNEKLREKITNLEYKITTLEDYKTRNKKAVELLQNLLPICIMPNNTLIHATEKAKVIEKAINTLQGKSDE